MLLGCEGQAHQNFPVVSSITNKMSTTEIAPTQTPSWPLSNAADRSGKKKRLTHLSLPVKNELISFIGEFCGTFMFLLLAFLSTHIVVTEQDPLLPMDSSGRLYISLAFGFSLAANVWIFYRISGGLFNPAVSIRTSG
jgi:hypothetical protein